MLTIGVLTISDSGAKGARQDTSGERIRAMVTQLPDVMISAGAIIPDERELIESTLLEWSDEKHLKLILTTGGTGLAPRDGSAMVVELHRHADDIIALLRQEGRNDRRINAARHRDDDERVGGQTEAEGQRPVHVQNRSAF